MKKTIKIFIFTIAVTFFMISNPKAVLELLETCEYYDANKSRFNVVLEIRNGWAWGKNDTTPYTYVYKYKSKKYSENNKMLATLFDWDSSRKTCPKYITIHDEKNTHGTVYIVYYGDEKEGLKEKDYTNSNGVILSLNDFDEQSEEISNDEENNTLDCDGIFSGEFGLFLKKILSIIKYIVPILIIGLSIIDFIKAAASQNDSEIKKAGNKLVKRLVIGVIIFLLPTLLDIILDLAGVEYGTCGIK